MKINWENEIERRRISVATVRTRTVEFESSRPLIDASRRNPAPRKTMVVAAAAAIVLEWEQMMTIIPYVNPARRAAPSLAYRMTMNPTAAKPAAPRPACPRARIITIGIGDPADDPDQTPEETSIGHLPEEASGVNGTAVPHPAGL